MTYIIIIIMINKCINDDDYNDNGGMFVLQRKEGRTIRSGCAIGGSPRINYIIINYDYELKLKLISSRSVIIVRPIL